MLIFTKGDLMKDIMIVCAKRNDYDQFKKLMSQIHQLHVQWRPDLYQPTEDIISFSNFEQLIKEERLWVAKIKEDVVGLMIIEYHHREGLAHQTRNILFIDTFVVDEDYRHQGIGQLLFDKAKLMMQEKLLDGIELHVSAANQEAIEIYKKMGMTTKSLCMEYHQKENAV